MNTNKLFDAMKAKGFTQKELAEKLGIAQGHLSFILSGRKVPSLNLFKKITEVLEVTADELLGE